MERRLSVQRQKKFLGVMKIFSIMIVRIVGVMKIFSIMIVRIVVYI